MTDNDDALTGLLKDAAAGKHEALEALLPLVYEDLRQRAAAYMRREQPGHSMQATALVHETYLRLLREPNTKWANRAHFLAIAAHSMRQILVERARARGRQKRAGDQRRVTLDDISIAAPEPLIDLAELDAALTRLGALDAQLARIVELRFFGGLSIEDTADAMGVSPATVKRGWTSARAWLRREMGPGPTVI